LAGYERIPCNNPLCHFGVSIQEQCRLDLNGIQTVQQKVTCDDSFDRLVFLEMEVTEKGISFHIAFDYGRLDVTTDPLRYTMKAIDGSRLRESTNFASKKMNIYPYIY
jgi:hypothetical protein